MTLGIRKIILLSLIGLVFLTSNVVLIANWLSEQGVIDWAKTIRENYLTGTAITILIALLILLTSPSRSGASGLIRRCPVCDKRLVGNVNYCSECGSKV
jgi:hypothetical protein